MSVKKPKKKDEMAVLPFHMKKKEGKYFKVGTSLTFYILR